MSMNPNAPDTIGLEWFVHSEALASLDAAARAAAFIIESSTAETIDGLYLPHQWVGPSSGYGRLWAEIYEAGDEVVTESPTTLTYKPNETKNSSGATRADFSSTTNLHTAIDDTDDSGPPEDTDYIVNANYWTTGSYASFQFDTAAIPNTWRILYVTLEVRCKGFDWSWQKPYVELDWYNGTTRLGQIGKITPPQDYVFRTYNLGPFYWDFHNEGPWLQPEIANLDSNTSRNLRVKLNYACAVSRVTLKVTCITENRQVVGISSKVTVPPSGMQTNAPISLKTPLNADNWLKATGTDYLVVVRRVEDPFGSKAAHTPQIAYLDGAVAGPHGQGVEQTVELGDASGKVTASTAGTTRTYAPTLGTSGGATSPDSQPYYDLAAQAVNAAVTVRQEVNGASAQSYRRVRAIVAVAGTPDQALTVTIKKASDDSQVGGTGTLTSADLADSSIATAAGTFSLNASTLLTLYEVQVTLASTATLAAATDYYVEVASSAAAATGWYLMLLDAEASHSLTTDRTYGGTTLSAIVSGSADTSEDFMLTVASIPTAPANLAAAVASVAMPDNGDALCDPGALEYVAVTWSVTSTGASFGRYELERSPDGGATWEPVANISTEATGYFNDFEVARGVEHLYRVRLARADGAYSDWSTSTGVTCATTGDQGSVYFVSNSDPTIVCAYVVATPDQSYRFPSADETVFMRLHQRDYQVAFKPSEVRGAAWSFPVMIYQGDGTAPPDGRGIRAFDTLRGVGEAAIPYVCVLTWNGERMFGAVQVPEGVESEPAGLYVAMVTVTQTQGSPSAVEV